LFFLGLSLAGQFEIGLTLTSAGGSLAAKQGYAGSFFTGVLAVVVATPCTAPFMGAAIGYALAQPAAVTFAVFTALALGLAAPYVALTLQPAWTRLLPKPGVWMDILKQAISVPIFGTVIWLAWVVAQAYGANLLLALLSVFLLSRSPGGSSAGGLPSAERLQLLRSFCCSLSQLALLRRKSLVKRHLLRPLHHRQEAWLQAATGSPGLLTPFSTLLPRASPSLLTSRRAGALAAR
jgi:thiol:disulfide interchange protein